MYGFVPALVVGNAHAVHRKLESMGRIFMLVLSFKVLFIYFQVGSWRFDLILTGTIPLMQPRQDMKRGEPTPPDNLPFHPPRGVLKTSVGK